MFLWMLTFWPLIMRFNWGCYSYRFGFLAAISLIIRPTDRPPLLSVLPLLGIPELGEGSGEGDDPLLFDRDTNWMFLRGILVRAEPFDPAESSDPDLFLPLRIINSFGFEPPNKLLSSWFVLLFYESYSCYRDKVEELAAPIRNVGDFLWAIY
jgi:hypothetical protein